MAICFSYSYQGTTLLTTTSYHVVVVYPTAPVLGRIILINNTQDSVNKNSMWNIAWLELSDLLVLSHNLSISTIDVIPKNRNR